MLGSFPISQLTISSRDSKENSNKGENRQTISRTVILQPIHEHTRETQQKGQIQHDRCLRAEDR